MNSAKRCVHIVCELSEVLFPFTGMNWEENTSGGNGKVKLNYSCAVYKCENIIYNEHISISTLRSPLRASSFQCVWFLRAEPGSSALCVLRFGSLCFLCICPVPACNVVTASRDTAGMTMSLTIYMKWFVNSTYKYSFPPQIPVGSCSVYDPVFSGSECDALKELGFTVLTENEVHTSTDLKMHLFCRPFLSIIFTTGGKASGLSTHPVLPDALWEGSV